MTHAITLQSALLPSGWARNVRVEWDAQGMISAVEADQANAQTGAMLPGLANCHSHAHQRAMAGLAERSGKTADSFWTWRDTMYSFLRTMNPEQLEAIAAQLYVECLQAGFTHIAEFQYLHHQPNGEHYQNLAEMSLRTLNAATDVGIGITCLPVHYQFAGFNEQLTSESQKRFFNTPDTMLRLLDELVNPIDAVPTAVLGIAGHSLRATSVDAFNAVLTGRPSSETPIHMHVAEQTREVDDCIAWSGQRPVEYCLNQFEVDERWCLIHATHMTEGETAALAKSQSVAGLCPTTEANLGDGFFNASNYLHHAGRIAIGSDSHISVSLVEELRWLEYGQRLVHRTRNQLAKGPESSTGAHLYQLAAHGGAQACGINTGAIRVGARADFVVLDTQSPILAARQGDEIIDSWIFSGNRSVVRDVYVAGRQVINNGRHAQQAAIEQRFIATVDALRHV